MSLSRRLLALAALVVALFSVPLPLSANPFLGTDSGPAPVARSGGSSTLTQAQFTLRERIASLLETFREQRSGGAIAALLAACFVYGILHALGPGHRKAVVFSLFLTRKARAWEPLAAGTLSALTHAATGIALILVLSLLSGAIAGIAKVENLGIWLEGFTFLALAVAAIILIAKTTIELIRPELHSHGGEGLERKGIYALILITSLVPCPGATMLLLFSLYAGLAGLGILGVLSMSLGMAVVITATAYLAWAGRTGLFNRLQKYEKFIHRVGHGLELCSYLFLLGFSLWTAWPFLRSLAY